MKELNRKNISTLSRFSGGRLIYAALVVIGFLLVTAASHDLRSIQREDASACAEYDELRELFYMTLPRSAADKSAAAFGSPAAEKAEGQNPGSSAADHDLPVGIPAGPLERLTLINPDFAGWISIEGTDVDYPIVRGNDNDRYLDTTYAGNSSPAGAIFMDCRNARGFGDSVCVIYGHNMRDGSMFAELNNYIEPAFMTEHPCINITTAEGAALTYRVFDAKLTDMRDTAHDPDSLASAAEAVVTGSPPGSGRPPGGEGRYLILSTCTPSADKEERMLVYALLTG